MRQPAARLIRLGAVVWLMALIGSLGLSSAFRAEAAAADDYTWRNVEIGGGGYTVQSYIHPANPDLIYIGTDVGGMYRYNPSTQRLKQLISRPPEEDNLYGCAGIALDKDNQNILYYGGGKYRGSSPHKLFKSLNQGDTWTLIDLPSGAAWDTNDGQANYRFGHRLVVNPKANTSQLFVGFANKGLYRLDFASDTALSGTWTQITSIPTTAAVNTIVFDPSDPNYVYVGLYDGTVYRSSNNGQSFSAIGSSAFKVLDMTITSDGANLFIATDQQGARRLDSPRTGTGWVTPAGLDSTSEFRAIEASPTDPGLVLTVVKGYNSLGEIKYSTNGGDSFGTKGSSVTRSIPWHPAEWPGSSISSFAFDPSDDNKVYITDWYSVYRTDNIRASTVAWKNDRGLGHEEVVSLALKALPTNSNGVLLLSGHADVDGFAHTSLNSVPSAKFSNRGATGISEATGLAYAPSNPNIVYLVGSGDRAGTLGNAFRSTDAGKTWSEIQEYNSDTNWGWGKVAVARNNPDNIVVATKQGVKYRTSNGGAFQAGYQAPDATALGLTGDIFSGSSWRDILVADLGADNTFFLYNKTNGQLYRSNDGGASWSLAGTLASSSSNVLGIASAPGNAGHIWAALGNAGVQRYSNGTISQVSAFSQALMIAIGATKPGASYPTVYVYGRLTSDTSSWIYRSTDQGASWERINSDSSRIGNSPENISADPSVYGRLYVGTNGTGIWVGELTGSATPQPTPTTPPGNAGSNLAASATAYRWTSNTSSTSNANRTAAPVLNDGSTTAEINLNGSGDDGVSNAYEGAGVVWGSAQSSITRVEFVNGSTDGGPDGNGNFTANFKLQFSSDGTSWTDASGWSLSPAYPYSAAAADQTYTFTGSTANVRGVRVVGQVRTSETGGSWHARSRELRAFGSGGTSGGGSASYTVESENGTYGGGSLVGTSQAGYSGSGYIDFGGNGSWSEVSITPSGSGTFAVAFRYANGSGVNRSASVTVNGVAAGTLTLADTGGWTTWGTETINLTLTGGSANAIRVTANTSNGGPNVDKVTATGP